MNILKEIHKAFNKHEIIEDENIYIPKIQNSVIPDPSTFNEISENIHKQLRLKTIKKLEL